MPTYRALSRLSALAMLLLPGYATLAGALESTSTTITYHHLSVGGVRMFYREAGPANAPTIVLLHGFPSSSREFAPLLPLLAAKYHLIAPDFPGFGQSEAPPAERYGYTFEHLAESTNGLLGQLHAEHCTFYLHDYGGPVGFRMFASHPERVAALIIQNANAYTQGLGVKWTAVAQYWADPQAHPEPLEAHLSLTAAQQRHTGGTSHPELYDPDTWSDEFAYLSRSGQHDIQAALLYDYRTNVASYPRWQAWLRQHQPPTLIVWGRNDPAFIAAGGEAYRRDLPAAEIHMLDAGHFILDEQNDETARLILGFMARQHHSLIAAPQ